MKNITELVSRFDPRTGQIKGVNAVERRLSDMRGCYLDFAAYEAELRRGDSLVYTVASVEPDSGPGDLHYGIGRIMPGKVGNEYYMTRGHIHASREAAEFYFGLSGDGMMLLEDAEGETVAVPLRSSEAVYVPGHTAHRTINTGDIPLTYLGVYPARAGHDYKAIAERGFKKVLVERDKQPVLMERIALCRVAGMPEV